MIRRTKLIAASIDWGEVRAALIDSEQRNADYGNDDPEGVIEAVLRALREAPQDARLLAIQYIAQGATK